MKLPKILLPTILAITAYIIVDRLFPEKAENPLQDLRGGGTDKLNFVKRIVKKILADRALKIGMLTLFASAGVQHFQTEVETLLVDEVFNEICLQKVDGQLKIVCDIVKEHELNLHAKSIKSLIIANDLTQDQKISLLKIKLDFIINGECRGKTRFWILASLGGVLIVTVSGVGGLALILEALYRLFEEGKIGKALYKQILKILAGKWVRKNVPVKHLLH